MLPVKYISGIALTLIISTSCGGGGGGSATAPMIAGDNWCHNQFLDPIESNRALVTKMESKMQVETLIPYL
ncbi:MAG: hypothetical protein CMQ20_13675 [Gammaproteobacteria bacterium]|jgi:hypothetical protein|nr:hypothetical protein [Gammaproteobacteria bacterium]|tara:strand:+ start:884 stop:1096 length:213 start_codon:yes stop_codon:yes gene_type:complete